MIKKFSFGFYQFCYYSILLLATILLGFLSIQSLFGGTFIPLKIAESVTFTQTAPHIYLFVFLFLASLLAIRPLLEKVNSKHFLICWIVLYILAGIYLIAGYNGVIRADAKHVFNAAVAFNQGDYSSLTRPGAYMYRNPHQLGLMTLERLYVMISPATQFAFAMNLGWTIGSNILLSKITQLLFKKSIIVNYTILLTFLFFPNLLFILFVYGSVPGLFFCLLSLWFFLLSQKTGRIWYLFFGTMAISIACLLRNNYQIFALMLIACFFLSLLRKFSWKKPLAIFLTIAGLIFSGRMVKGYYSDLVGRPIGGGTPLIAYVTMGLRDDPNRATLGGWYDAYNTKILKRFHFDEKKANQQAKEDLLNRIAIFIQKPQYAIKFFYEKVRSTWTEPTFQSIWTGPQIARRQYTYTSFLRSIYEGRNGYRIANDLGSILLISIYLLSTAFLLFKLFWAKLSLEAFELYPYIFFMGGFVFHFFWETKSQYVYMYILLLIPTAAQALVQFGDWIKKKRAH